MSKGRILAYMDSPDCPSGFGQVAQKVLFGLKDLGWEIVGCFGINSPGLYNPAVPFPVWAAQGAPEDGPMRADSHDPYGRVRFLHFLNRSPDHDILLMLQDTFTLSKPFQFIQSNGKSEKKPFIRAVCQKEHEFGRKVVTYHPVDSTIWPQWLDGFQGSHGPDQVVTYTDWGVRETEVVCPELSGGVKRIYHGSDPEFFSKVTKSKKDLRDKWFEDAMKDKFVILWIGANQRRKRLDLIFESYRYFLDHCCPPGKQKPLLVIRSEISTQSYSGWNLANLASSFGLQRDQIVFVNNKVVPEGLRALYQMADAFMYLSMEGWGLCITEAMSAGLPCVLADHSSLVEIGAEGRAHMVPIAGYSVLPSDHEVRRLEPSIQGMAEGLAWIRDNPADAKNMTRRAMRWCKENSWKKICNQWDDLLSKIMVSRKKLLKRMKESTKEGVPV